MWYKVVQSGESLLGQWDARAENEEPVEIRPKSTTNSPNRPTLTDLRTLLTSLVAVVVVMRNLAQRARELRAARSFGAMVLRIQTCFAAIIQPGSTKRAV